MTWRVLPPAGNPIAFDERERPLPEFEGFEPIWLDSGTSALALALLIARGRHPELASPEVVLPGYGCPDLVAAAVYAGVKPVIADILPDDPGYDLESLQAAISERTVAVVAVNFLGVRDRLGEIRQIVDHASISLIEDNAQWFPESQSAAKLEGDCVVLSFGRGKPVSLLGGGALLVRKSLQIEHASWMARIRSSEGGSSFRMKAALYNLLRSPLLYGAIARIPMLEIGKTEYHALHQISAMDAHRLRLLPANIDRYVRRNRNVEAELARIIPERMNIPRRTNRSERLLRFPILLDDARQRDRVYAQLTELGLGASTMYGSALSQIESVKPFVDTNRATPNAASFAARLMTLPTHQDVTPEVVRAIAKVLSD